MVAGLLRIARGQNVTQIIVGKPVVRGPLSFLRRALRLHRLVRASGGIDIHVVRVEGSEIPQRPPLWRLPGKGARAQYLQALGAVAAARVEFHPE